MNAYTDLGTALFDLVDGLDITAIVPGSWVAGYDRPVKQIPDWPCFAVYPATDATIDLDNYDDEVHYTYWIDLYYSYQDAPDAEGTMRLLADLVTQQVRREKRQQPP